jgi:hypothetical protein
MMLDSKVNDVEESDRVRGLKCSVQVDSNDYDVVIMFQWCRGGVEVVYGYGLTGWQVEDEIVQHTHTLTHTYKHTRTHTHTHTHRVAGRG